MKRIILIISLGAVLFACEPSQNGADAYGNFEATEVFVAAENPGKVVHMAIYQGQVLEKSQVIAIIDTTQLHLKRGQLKATIRALRNKLGNVPVQLQVFTEKQQVLEREINRVNKLLKDGAATQKQLDDLTGELQVVLKQKDALESQLSTANRGILAEIEPLQWQIRQLEDQIYRSKILSPIQGTVLETYKTEGEIAGMGQALAKLADLRQMELRIYVDAQQLSQVKLGAKVSVLTDGKDGNMDSHPGEVIWISPNAEFTPKVIQTKNERVNLVYAVKVRVANEGFLKIGMPAEVTFD